MSLLPNKRVSHRNVAMAKQPSARQGKESLAQQTVTTSLTHSDGQIGLEGDEGRDRRGSDKNKPDVGARSVSLSPPCLKVDGRMISRLVRMNYPWPRRR